MAENSKQISEERSQITTLTLFWMIRITTLTLFWMITVLDVKFSSSSDWKLQEYWLAKVPKSISYLSMDSVPRPSYRPSHWRIDRARSNWSSFLMWHDRKFRGVYCKIRSVGLGMRWSSRLKILSQSFGNESSLTLFCTPKVFDDMNDFLKRFWEIQTLGVQQSKLERTTSG